MPEAPSVWTVLSMLEWATGFFEQKNVRSPRLSIEWLLADVLSVKRLDLYLSYDRPLSSEELERLRPMVKRRALHEPLQYITGETDFHNVKIKVEPGVLIPRSETEQLVEIILKKEPGDSEKKVVDLGTGSGCIPIALKKARPEWKVTATDISEEALAVAKKNAELNEVEINFLRDDFFSPSAFSETQKIDLIISNPPYILSSEKDLLDEEVKNFEPEIALFCSSTKKMYGAIEKFASDHLAQNGTMFLEMHESHAEEVLDFFKAKNWRADIQKDYDQKPRFLTASKK